MLGMALTGAGPSAGVEEVLLLDRDARTADSSLARGAAHRLAADVEDALSADTIVLAIPVSEIVAFLERNGSALGSGSLVIDTGSAKTAVVQAMRRTVGASKGAMAVGGHPIAGTETPGPAGAKPGLLEGAPFVLTPVRQDDTEAMERGRALARAVGARPVEMSAEAHDAVVARTSHLPHVAAYAISLVVGAAAVGDRSDGSTATRYEDVRALVSSGYRGATRLAAGDPGMIAGFLSANAQEVGAALDELGRVLARFRSSLGDPDRLAALLAEGRLAREAMA